MSGCSFDEPCPKCGGTMDAYSDWKPHNFCSGQCLQCGYHYWTETGRMSLKVINEVRTQWEQKPLKRRKAWRREA